MRVVRGADVDRFDVGVAQHVMDIQVDGVDTCPSGVVSGGVFDDIAYGHQPDLVAMIEEGGQVSTGDAARADQADLQWFGHVSHLPRGVYEQEE